MTKWRLRGVREEVGRLRGVCGEICMVDMDQGKIITSTMFVLLWTEGKHEKAAFYEI